MTIEKWFFIIISAVIGYLFWKVLEPFLLVILLASVVAIILSPIDKHLRKLVRSQRLSALILSVAVFFLVFIPLLVMLFLMGSQASDLVQVTMRDTSWIEKLDTTISPLVQALPSSIQNEIKTLDLVSIGKSIATWAFENLGAFFSSTSKLILNTFIFFLCLYYLLEEREALYKEALALSPLQDKLDIGILKRVVNTVRSVVFGVLLVALIQGVIAGIGMTIFGVPGALIWGALTAVAALVPIIGTGLIIIPAILYLFFTGSTYAAVGLLIWSVVLVATADNLIGPYLISGKTHMNAFLVLLSVLGGLSAFGTVGAIAGPTILAALLAIIELYKTGILTTGKPKIT